MLARFFVFFLVFLLITFASSIKDLGDILDDICGKLYEMLPPLSMLLVVAGAVVYAAGQFASAEMRARATGWATVMLTSAIFVFILILLMSGVIKTLISNLGLSIDLNCGGAFGDSKRGGSGGGSGGGSDGEGLGPDRSGIN